MLSLVLRILLACFFLAVCVFWISGRVGSSTYNTGKQSASAESGDPGESAANLSLDPQGGQGAPDVVSPYGEKHAGEHEKHQLDTRSGISAGGTPVQMRALEKLKGKVPGVDVQFDPLSGSASHVMAAGSFLTGPSGGGSEGGLREFLDTNRDLFGYGAEALDRGAVLAREDEAPKSGMRTLVWQQELDGVPLYNTVFRANLTKAGELLGVGSHFLKDPAAASGMDEGRRAELRERPPVGVERALEVAALGVGDAVSAAEVRVKPGVESARRTQYLEAESVTDARGELVWVPMNPERVVLAWEVIWMSREQGEMFRAAVHAETGEVLLRTSLTSDLSPSSYRVHVHPGTRKPLDSPRPLSPGYASPQSAQPEERPRELVTLDALDLGASPEGWLPENRDRTFGNNVDAHLDLSNTNPGYGVGAHAVGVGRVFDFPMPLDRAPSEYREAAVTTLFYLCNWYHDRLYSLGFTERSGNFQHDNFGRGGVGADAVLADAQDGSGTNNANFSTPPDGMSGRMQMFVFTTQTPSRDSSLDAEVVFHEYTHGLSNRLVGGGVGMSALQAWGMGEGWSDFYGLSLLSEPGDDLGGNYAAGGYLTGNYYKGIRTYPYTTDMSKNPHTLKHIDPSQGGVAQVHYMGSIWCVTLWEARANLIAKHGWEVGNELMLQLVTDGMKLSPVNPTFLQARDSILQADLNLTRGANQKELWRGFAKRGMGASAQVPASSTSTGVREAFDLPDALQITPRDGLTLRMATPGRVDTQGQMFVLRNLDTENAVRWTAAPSVNWLTVSPIDGVLAAGASAEVWVALKPEAGGLSMGGYTGEVFFRNLLSGADIVRSVQLFVGNKDAYTELFDAAFPNDTDFQSWMFIPDGSSAFYRVERTVVPQFPADPSGGTGLSMGDDTSVSVTLPSGRFASLYGKTYSQFYVGSNGYLTFGGADIREQESYATHFLMPRVSGLFTDLFPGAGAVSWKVWPDRVAVTWQEVPHYRTGGKNSFQVELYQDGRIRISCLGVDVVGGLIGLSPGGGIPPGFLKSDFSRYGQPPELPAAGLAYEVPGTISEGAGRVTAKLVLNQVAQTELVVALRSSVPERIRVPERVSVSAGAREVFLELEAVENERLDGDAEVILQASADGWTSGTAVVKVLDNEIGGSFSVRLPESIQEGGAEGQGTLVLSMPAEVAFQVQLVATVPGDAWVPASVTVPAGALSVLFPIRAVNDTRIDGTVISRVVASASGWQSGESSISVLDNEERRITLTRFPTQVFEGSRLTVGVAISGTLPENLVVSLQSSVDSRLAVPQTATIPAGATQAFFVIYATNNSLNDGAVNVSVTGTATGFESTSIDVKVLDDDVHRFLVSPVAARQIRGVPIPVTISALDVNGQVVGSYTSALSVAAAGASGPLRVTPEATGRFSAGVWRGSVVVDGYDTGVTLRFSGALGLQAQSNPFDMVRGALDHFGWKVPSGEQISRQGIPVQIEAQDAGNNRVEEFGESVRLMGVATRDIGQALGSGGVVSSLIPLYTQLPVQRTQCVYTRDELERSGKIHSLALDLASLPSGTVGRWTIRMRHTSLSEPASWETAGWTTVFQGDARFATRGWTTFRFSAPFEYDGVSNLMVDFSFQSSVPTAQGGSVVSTRNSTRRPSMSWAQSSGEPLSWSGLVPEPVRFSELPNLRLGWEIGVEPGVTSRFVSGVWSGQVAVTSADPQVTFVAVADGGISGESSLISLPDVIPPSEVAVSCNPTGGRVEEGEGFALQAAANGTPPFSYQWRKDGESIPGATASVYAVGSARLSDQGSYRVEVRNAAGVATSADFPVTVLPRLEIVEQPVAQTVNPGARVVFSVRAEGVGVLRYQWFKGEMALPDATQSTLVLPSVTESDEGEYRVMVGNETRRKSSVGAYLTVNDPVRITQSPQGGVLDPGRMYELTVTASGTGPLEYQWYRNDVPVKGATSESLRFDPVTETLEGVYKVAVRNVVGEVFSETTRVWVRDLVGFSSAGVRQPKFPGELLFPVVVRREGGAELAASVRMVRLSSSLPESAFRTESVQMDLSWAVGESGEKAILIGIKAGIPIRPEGEQLVFALTDPQNAVLGAQVRQVVTILPAEPGVLSFRMNQVELQAADAGEYAVEIPVARQQGSMGAVGVEVVAVGGSAPAGVYTLEASALRWQDAESADKVVRVRFSGVKPVPADGWILVLKLQNPMGGAMLGAMNTLRIRVNPPAARGVFSFGAPSYRFLIQEPGDRDVLIPVHRSGGAAGRVAVMVGAAGGTGIEGRDYLIPEESRALVWEDGEAAPKNFKLVFRAGAQIPEAGLKIQLKLREPAGGAGLGALDRATLTFVNSDDRAPVVTMLSPANGGTVSGESVVFKGTALDLSGIHSVELVLNNEAPVLASLLELPDGSGVTWMASLVPEPGQNQIQVIAYGEDGMVSDPLIRNFRFVYQRPVLAGTYDGVLEPAAILEDFAVASTDYRSFELSRGSGVVSATVTVTGAVSGRVSVAGVEIPFTASVGKDGVLTFGGGLQELRMLRPGIRDALGVLSLWMDGTGDLPVLRGEWKSAESGVWYGQVAAEKCVFSDARVLPDGMQRVPRQLLDPASDNGRYTFAWVRDESLGLGQSNQLKGLAGQVDGTGTIRVLPSGAVILLGRFKDGAVVSCGSRLSASWRFPFYESLYRRNGFVGGRIQFGELENADAVSDFSIWVQPATGTNVREEHQPAVLVSRYVAPERPRNGRPVPANPHTIFGAAFPASIPEGVRGVPSIRVDLDCPVLNGVFEGVLQVGTDGSGVLVEQNSTEVRDLRFRFESLDGSFTASFRQQGGRVPIPLHGVVFQKQGMALGLGEVGGSWRVELAAQIPQTASSLSPAQ